MMDIEESHTRLEKAAKSGTVPGTLNEAHLPALLRRRSSGCDVGR